MGLRRNKPLCQTFQKTTSTPSQYRLLLISMLCLLSKLFAKIQNSLSSLREKVQAGAPVFRLADGCLPGMSYPVTVRCSHWSFQTDDLGGETECWFCTQIFLFYLYKRKGNSSSLNYIFFLYRLWKKAKITIYCTQHKPLFTTWNHFITDDRDGGIPNLALNASGSRQLYTQSGINLRCCQKSHLCPHLALGSGKLT